MMGGKIYGVLNKIAQAVNDFGTAQDIGFGRRCALARKGEMQFFAALGVGLGRFAQDFAKRGGAHQEIIFARLAHFAQNIAAAVGLGANGLGILAQGRLI